MHYVVKIARFHLGVDNILQVFVHRELHGGASFCFKRLDDLFPDRGTVSCLDRGNLQRLARIISLSARRSRSRTCLLYTSRCV